MRSFGSLPTMVVLTVVLAARSSIFADGKHGAVVAVGAVGVDRPTLFIQATILILAFVIFHVLQFTTLTPFVMLGKGDAGAADPPFSITSSYAAQQAMAVRFLTDAFAGKVPNVTGFVPPVRDFDGDGFDDSVDSDPNNPNVH